MSMEEYLRGEGAALSTDRTSIDWDTGDRLRWLGNALIGRGAEFSREGVRSRAKTQREKDFNEGITTDLRLAEDLLAGTGVRTQGAKLGGTKTEKEAEANLGSLIRTGKNVQRAVSETPGLSPSDFGAGSTLTTVLSKQNEQRRKNKVDERERLERIEERRLTRDYLEEKRRFDSRSREREIAHQDSIALKRENLDLSRLQLQMDQSKYMYDLQTQRQNIRQKQATGLAEAIAALGIAFTV